MQNILTIYQQNIEKYLTEINLPKYHAKQIIEWIYKKNILDFDNMTNLPKNLKEQLKINFEINNIKIQKKQISTDGAIKYLFKLADNNFIETVFIPSRDRYTICLSSQVGCKFNCAFCASGKSGFSRNLTTDEIILQILNIMHDQKLEKINNIVFMGIGEPLDNMDNVLNAIKIINDKDKLNIGARKITISTCGLAPQIKKLAGFDMQIELAISLHSPLDKLRSELLPINKKYNIQTLIKTCKDYTKKTGRQITFAYIMLNNINDSNKYAEELAKLLKGNLFKVNIINFNKTANQKYLPAKKETIKSFMEILEKNKIPVTLRMPRGQDISAACGQLKLEG